MMVLIEGAPTQDLQGFMLNEGESAEREGIAEELYRKKRLCQCFIGWLSIIGARSESSNI
jgi:hypothetical protein